MSYLDDPVTGVGTCTGCQRPVLHTLVCVLRIVSDSDPELARDGSDDCDECGYLEAIEAAS